MVDLDDFKEEVTCEYKGEIYSVRDNGAIMRHPKNNSRIRRMDNKWTFGTKNEDNGYMFFASSVRVHQVVATAFWGHIKEEGMVVDHKDTNRCNNRVENLHWVTKLENALNNPITRRRIINICGSVEAFIENPALLRESTVDPNFKWMRTVTKEEAAKCRANLERWSIVDTNLARIPHGDGIGEWVFSDYYLTARDTEILQGVLQTKGSEYQLRQVKEQNDNPKLSLLLESLTDNAMQDWKTPTEFPLCPTDVLSLVDYYSYLKKGEVFSKNIHGAYIIIEAAISDDNKRMCVATYNPEASIKGWYVTYVYILNHKYIHENGGSFLSENGALKTITLFQGKDWTGGDCIDDYC